ncbi:CidA/LrgA family protein [Serratia ficaria]|uniref:CidA/LrgA family protein n=1 Tax=Serratia ficaria TaxID=61651 RepID=UPI002177D9A7|nr:CidA/LrgA family protein [Serratia ficaria]CAI0837307.1 Putative effector of murein hydrolase LrgA [Serratia ficaria]CAI0881464.1 Putative effector of murein hydrolase LrgA [Serratia ficaria]CAI1522696.1 Putative effector of murein hydrolase LrgA [Serratia ficaria]CAI2061569.1 Putative effector of murein hydrolase LrgA [Serratia ficaria]CAI2402303.1 Putative effector of murein hydrolase LrgA [Serratia ficaria]
MANVFTVCWKYLRALVLIYLCLFVGNALAALLPIAIPGSIIGMLLLFALLATQILPAKWVKPGCHLLIRYMVLLFVPIGVGVMEYYGQIVEHLGPLVVSCLISTLMVLVVVGYSSHYFHRERRIIGKPEDEQ